MLTFPSIPGMRAPALAFCAMGFVFGAFAAFVPVLKAQIGATDAVFGMIFLLGSSAAVAAVRLAPIADRALGAFSVPVCSVGLALAMLILSLAPNIWVFTLAMLLVSGFAGVTDIVMNARISEVESAQDRQLMSLNHGLFSLCYAASALSTGLAREAGIGPVPVFAFILVLNILMGLFMRAPHGAVQTSGAAAEVTVPPGLIWIGGLIVLTGFFAEVSVESWSALYIERDLGGGAAQGAMGPAILGLTMAFGRFFGHVLGRFVRETTLIGLACLLTGGGAVAATLAQAPGMAQLGFGIMGLGMSVIAPLALGLVGRSVPPTQRVGALAKVSAIGYGAFLLGPVVMGGVAELTSLATAFLLVGLTLFAVAVLLVPLLARRLHLGERSL